MKKLMTLACAALICGTPSMAYAQSGADRPMTDRELAHADRERQLGNMIDPYCIEVKLPDGSSTFGCFEQHNYMSPKTLSGQ